MNYIGEYAFLACGGLSGQVTIPDGVTNIGDAAFNGCSSLTGTLTIPNAVEYIGDFQFDGCANLAKIQYNGTMTQWNAIPKGEHWRNVCPLNKIYCTDGVVSI